MMYDVKASLVKYGTKPKYSADKCIFVLFQWDILGIKLFKKTWTVNSLFWSGGNIIMNILFPVYRADIKLI